VVNISRLAVELGVYMSREHRADVFTEHFQPNRFMEFDHIDDNAGN
jgi:hypothetical protein